MKPGISLSCLVLLLLALPQLAQADAQNDFYIQQALDHYFPLPQDAHSLSVGGSSDLSCIRSSCIHLNPAGLGLLFSTEFSGTIGNGERSGEEFLGLEGSDHISQVERNGSLILAIPLGTRNQDLAKYGTIGIAYSRYQGHVTDSIRTSPDGHLRTIAYGYAPISEISLGYMFTFYDDQLHSELADLHSTSRLLHVFGIQLRPWEEVSLGSIIRLGIGKSDTEDFLLLSDGLSSLRQLTTATGISVHLGRTTLSLSFDFSSFDSDGSMTEFSRPVVVGGDEDGTQYNFRLGAEAMVIEQLFVRTGVFFQEVDYDFDRPDLTVLSGSSEGIGLAGGLGYVFGKEVPFNWNFRLDYGAEHLTTARGNWRHLLTATMALK